MSANIEGAIFTRAQGQLCRLHDRVAVWMHACTRENCAPALLAPAHRDFARPLHRMFYASIFADNSLPGRRRKGRKGGREGDGGVTEGKGVGWWQKQSHAKLSLPAMSNGSPRTFGCFRGPPAFPNLPEINGKSFKKRDVEIHCTREG